MKGKETQGRLLQPGVNSNSTKLLLTGGCDLPSRVTASPGDRSGRASSGINTDFPLLPPWSPHWSTPKGSQRGLSCGIRLKGGPLPEEAGWKRVGRASGETKRQSLGQLASEEASLPGHVAPFHHFTTWVSLGRTVYNTGK